MLKGHYKEVFEKQDIHWWYKGMRSINQVLLDLYLPKNEKIEILDAGCGPGAMLPTLAKYGNVTGVDLSKDALKFAKKRGNAKLGDITNLAFKDKSFDLVICMDVLYHSWVKDENKALQEFKRVLKPGGILLLREPAYNWLRGNQDAVGFTTRRFDKTTIKRSLKGNSFKVIKITFANFFLFPIVLLTRVVGKTSQKNNSHSDLAMLPKPLNELLFTILKLESFLIRFVSLPFGSSLICMAQRV